jgi:hypothetical protein
MSSYDYIAKSILNTTPPPAGITVDIVEYPDQPGLVYLRLYAIEIHDQPDSKAEQLAVWLAKILVKLNDSLSIGKYTWEMSTDLPR